MKLNERSRKIIRTISLNADATIKEIGQMTKLPEHIVRWELDRLLEAEVIRRTAFVDLCRIGYCFYAILFSISSSKNDLKHDLLKDLLESPEVAYLAQVGGDFQYHVVICCQQHIEVKQFLKKFSEQYQNIFFEKTISVHVDWTLFTRKYLAAAKPRIEELRSGEVYEKIELSEQDKKILRGFANIQHRSKRDIARAMSIPLSTFDTRLKDLQAKQILKGFIYEVRPIDFGVELYVLLIYAKGVDPARKEDLYLFSKQHPNIIVFVECLGDWEYELNVEVENAEQITDLTQEIYELFGNSLISIKVVPILKRMKFSLFPF